MKAMIKPVGATRSVLTPDAKALIRMAIKVFVRRGDSISAARCRETLYVGSTDRLRLGKNSRKKGANV